MVAAEAFGVETDACCGDDTAGDGKGAGAALGAGVAGVVACGRDVGFDVEGCTAWWSRGSMMGAGSPFLWCR